MFCQNCGQEISNNVNFCNHCGVPVTSKQPVYQQTQPVNRRVQPGLVGFSPRINDPAFEAYKKNSKNWSFLFAFILGIIAIIAFPIYGKASGEINWPNSLYYGMGIGGMFILIALLQTIRRGTDKTWEGIISYKNTFRERDNNEDGIGHYHTAYVLKVRKESGGTKTHKWRDMPGPYEYYNVGDRVRHNKGFYYYEKYDKSKDSQIMCAACMSFNNINADVCARCKCPLLKV